MPERLAPGRNDHIGFNEPGSAFDGRTHVARLTPSTIAANASDFAPDETPPPEAATIGIGTILEAQSIILVAIGSANAEALARAFQSPPDVDCPASALQHGVRYPPTNRDLKRRLAFTIW